MKLINKLLFAIVILTASSCKKENAGWTHKLATPLAHGELDILGEYVGNDTIGDTLQLIWNSKLFNISADTLLSIPDTSINKRLETQFGGIVFQPGDTLFEPPSSPLDYNIEGLQLSRLILKDGKGELRITNTTEEGLDITYGLPFATKNGQPFSLTHYLPAASLSSPGVTVVPFDLSGYTFDLRGENGNSYNQMLVDYTVVLATTSNPLTLVAGTYLSIETEFIDWKAAEAFGQFTGLEFDLNEEDLAFEEFEALSADSLFFSEATLKLNIENGLGIDIDFNLEELVGNHPEKGSVSLEGAWKNQNWGIARATRLNNKVTASSKEIILDNNNSNLNYWISHLPNSVSLVGEISSNPYGNNSNSTDFVIENNGINMAGNLQIPLAFYSKNFTLVDTVDFQSENINSKSIVGGTFYVYTENRYPFTLKLEANLVDSNGAFIAPMFDEPKYIDASENYQVIESELQIPFDKQKIDQVNQCDRIELLISISTLENMVYIKPDTPIYVTITADLDVESSF